MMDGTTIREATQEWVGSFDAIPLAMVRKLWLNDPDDWYEITTPHIGDRVYVYEVPEGCEKHSGTIENLLSKADMYLINLDDGTTIEVGADDFEVERDTYFPMWGTMWSFSEAPDEYWLTEMDGVKLMSNCGFRVYESDQFGYFFGIDGAGYDFYDEHWIPLYKARGLKWHDQRTENGSYVMRECRKAELYDKLLSYLSEMISSPEELVNVLRGIGFRDEEIEYEGLSVMDY